MNNPPETWRWFGNAGHLCMSHECRFHLATKVGDYLVSTIGEWHPIKNGKAVNVPENIGYNRLYETMVFATGAPCSCGCGLPRIEGNELMFHAADSAGEANKNHLEFCLKIANGYNPTENE